jgi:hypothetical protein
MFCIDKKRISLRCCNFLLLVPHRHLYCICCWCFLFLCCPQMNIRKMQKQKWDYEKRMKTWKISIFYIQRKICVLPKTNEKSNEKIYNVESESEREWEEERENQSANRKSMFVYTHTKMIMFQELFCVFSSPFYIIKKLNFLFG